MNSPTELKIWLPGRVPSKKNSKQVTRGGRIISSKKYLEWEENALSYLSKYYSDLSIPWSTLDISCYFWWPDSRRTDASNKFESIADLFVKYQLIADDNYSILENVHLFSQGKNKTHPGVLVIIKPAISNIIEHPLQEQINVELEAEAALKLVKKVRKPRAKKQNKDLEIAA